MGKNQSEGLLLEATLASPVFVEKDSQKLTYAYFLFGRHWAILIFEGACFRNELQNLFNLLILIELFFNAQFIWTALISIRFS